MFTGLSAFPLTPIDNTAVDERSFIGLVERLVEADVDTIGALGSTGNYAYLNRDQRRRVAQLAVQHAGGIPVIVGISALSTLEVLGLAEDAQAAGASAVLLAPMSYQQLTADEVFSLYETVTAQLSVPLCVYDNPRTTHFTFSDELHGEIARLPQVQSIKILGASQEAQAARERVNKLRAQIPAHVSIGVSGDVFAAAGLNAGCDLWYSVIGGLYPRLAKAITTAAQSGDGQEALHLSQSLQPIWDLFEQGGGSLRVMAAAAELQGLVKSPCLPPPLKALGGAGREQLGQLLKELQLS